MCQSYMGCHPYSHMLSHPLDPHPSAAEIHEGRERALLLKMPGSFEISKGLAETCEKAIWVSTLRRNTVPTVGREPKAPSEQGAQSCPTLVPERSRTLLHLSPFLEIKLLSLNS